MIATLILALWYLWRYRPDVVLCAAFWLAIIWFIHSKRLIHHAGGFLVLIGVVLNALVTELNGGVMPVVGMPMNFRTAAPIWQAAQTGSRCLLLADRASLRFFSIGDFVLLAGASLLLLGKVLSAASIQASCPPSRN